MKLKIKFRQSDREYEIIDWIHVTRGKADGIVIDPAAFTHTSIAILDALNACEFPIIEVHISNLHRREAFRHHSYVSGVASGVIAGFGTQGYQLALRRLARLIDAAAAKSPSAKRSLQEPGIEGPSRRACRRRVIVTTASGGDRQDRPPRRPTDRNRLI